MFADWADRQGFCGVTNVPAPGPIEPIEQGIELPQFHVERLVNQDNIGVGSHIPLIDLQSGAYSIWSIENEILPGVPIAFRPVSNLW
jgi:hypothetical protein